MNLAGNDAAVGLKKAKLGFRCGSPIGGGQFLPNWFGNKLGRLVTLWMPFPCPIRSEWFLFPTGNSFQSQVCQKGRILDQMAAF